MERVDRFIRDPHRALFTLTGPFLVSMIVQVLYNVVDTAFIGRVGSDALAAITFAFPVLFMLISINSGIGIGMRSLISRSLGAKNKEEAEIAATHALFLTLAIALIIFIIGMVAMDTLFALFGASEAVRPLAQEYLSILLLAVFFMFTSGIFMNIFSGQGDTKTPMYITVASLVTNIILDPIFIFGLDMGVRGAAVATLLAFAVATVSYIFVFRKRSQIRFRLKGLRWQWTMVAEILRVGVPASLTMLIITIYFMFINRFMAHFSMDHVAAFGIVARLESVMVMPMAALGLSLVTLVGMFYGAKEYEKMIDVTWMSLRYALAFAVFMGVVMFIWPAPFLRIFTPDARLIELGAAYMRYNVFTFPLMAVTQIVSRSMQGLGYGTPGLVINALRVLIGAIPLAYIFIFLVGLPYYFVAVAGIIGGTIASIVGLLWLRSLYARCRNSTTASA